MASKTVIQKGERRGNFLIVVVVALDLQMGPTNRERRRGRRRLWERRGNFLIVLVVVVAQLEWWSGGVVEWWSGGVVDHDSRKQIIEDGCGFCAVLPLPP
jgi:hypothetical protein